MICKTAHNFRNSPQASMLLGQRVTDMLRKVNAEKWEEASIALSNTLMQYIEQWPANATKNNNEITIAATKNNSEMTIAATKSNNEMAVAKTETNPLIGNDITVCFL